VGRTDADVRTGETKKIPPLASRWQKCGDRDDAEARRGTKKNENRKAGNDRQAEAPRPFANACIASRDRIGRFAGVPMLGRRRFAFGAEVDEEARRRRVGEF
jgi:hypothetical protein